MNKKLIIGLILLGVVGVAGLYYMYSSGIFSSKEVVEEIVEVQPDYPVEAYEVIGTSVEGRDIRAFSFGEGDKTLVFIGALHGGYEWNTALLAYELLDHLDANPNLIPSDIEVVVIPVANPDGLHMVMGSASRFFAGDAPQFEYADEISLEDDFVAGRFNANGVDLNRNFDCKWQEDAVWRDYPVGAGVGVFSEPESRALRDYLLRKSPKAVVALHSASDGVYTSFCEGDALEGTDELLDIYSEATGYTRYDDYPYYEVTGDLSDWLSTVDIPAITVELSTHTAIEWDRNYSGVEAMLEFYSEIE